MWITHRVLWSVSCTSNQKINTVNWLHGLFKALKQNHLVCQMYRQHSWLYQGGNFHTKKIRLISFLLNPLSPSGDQHQFSPNNIHTLSRDKVMRIYEMIAKQKMLWSAIKFSQLILLGNVWRSVWRICMRILGLKGLSQKRGRTFIYT